MLASALPRLRGPSHISADLLFSLGGVTLFYLGDFELVASKGHGWGELACSAHVHC